MTDPLCPDCGADLRSFEPHGRFCETTQKKQPEAPQGLLDRLEQWLAASKDPDSWRGLSAIPVDLIQDCRDALARVSVPTEPPTVCLFRQPVRPKPCPDMNLDEIHWCGACLKQKYDSLAAVVAPPPQKEFDWRVRLGNLIDRKNMMGDFKFGMAVVDLIYDYDRLAVAPPQPHTEQK